MFGSLAAECLRDKPKRRIYRAVAEEEFEVPDSEDARSTQFYRLVGAKVRSARIEAGLSQATLAEQVGLTRSSMANLEAARQRTSLYHFVLISRALGVEVSSLLPNDPSPLDSQLESSLKNELADSPETTQDFVLGAVARLNSNAKTEINQ
jgi:transcriptional regulator with XRE-family HTH domain